MNNQSNAVNCKQECEITLAEGSLFDDGRYKIVKLLGEGLCSKVYLAERQAKGFSGEQS
jgi:hypothetical protein